MNSIQTETENKDPKVTDTKVESISVVFSFYQPTLIVTTTVMLQCI